MPDNPLQVERKGNLQEFGLPFEEGIVEKDADFVDPDPDAQEETGPDPDEGLTPTHTPARDGQTSTPVEGEEATEEEEEDPAEYDEVLSRVRSEYAEQPAAKPVDSENEALKQRLAALEGQLKSYTPQPAPVGRPAPEKQVVEEEGGIDYSDPAVQAALAQGFSDPKTIGTTMKALVTLEAKALINKEIGGIKEQVQDIKEGSDEEANRHALSAQLATGLQAAYNMGGLEAAIVREADEKREGSMLYQYLEINPELAKSPQGIVTATLAVSRAVQRADDQLQEGRPDEKKGPAPLTTRRQTRATKRGQKLITPKAEGTQEDSVKADILGAGRPSQAIEFMR